MMSLYKFETAMALCILILVACSTKLLEMARQARDAFARAAAQISWNIEPLFGERQESQPHMLCFCLVKAGGSLTHMEGYTDPNCS